MKVLSFFLFWSQLAMAQQVLGLQLNAESGLALTSNHLALSESYAQRLYPHSLKQQQALAEFFKFLKTQSPVGLLEDLPREQRPLYFRYSEALQLENSTSFDYSSPDSNVPMELCSDFLLGRLVSYLECLKTYQTKLSELADQESQWLKETEVEGRLCVKRNPPLICAERYNTQLALAGHSALLEKIDQTLEHIQSKIPTEAAHFFDQLSLMANPSSSAPPIPEAIPLTSTDFLTCETEYKIKEEQLAQCRGSDTQDSQSVSPIDEQAQSLFPTMKSIVSHQSTPYFLIALRMETLQAIFDTYTNHFNLPLNLSEEEIRECSPELKEGMKEMRLRSAQGHSPGKHGEELAKTLKSRAIELQQLYPRVQDWVERCREIKGQPHGTDSGSCRIADEEQGKLLALLTEYPILSTYFSDDKSLYQNLEETLGDWIANPKTKMVQAQQEINQQYKELLMSVCNENALRGGVPWTQLLNQSQIVEKTLKQYPHFEMAYQCATSEAKNFDDYQNEIFDKIMLGCDMRAVASASVSVAAMAGASSLGPLGLGLGFLWRFSCLPTRYLHSKMKQVESDQEERLGRMAQEKSSTMSNNEEKRQSAHDLESSMRSMLAIESFSVGGESVSKLKSASVVSRGFANLFNPVNEAGSLYLTKYNVMRLLKRVVDDSSVKNSSCFKTSDELVHAYEQLFEVEKEVACWDIIPSLIDQLFARANSCEKNQESEAFHVMVSSLIELTLAIEKNTCEKLSAEFPLALRDRQCAQLGEHPLNNPMLFDLHSLAINRANGTCTARVNLDRSTSHILSFSQGCFTMDSSGNYLAKNIEQIQKLSCPNQMADWKRVECGAQELTPHMTENGQVLILPKKALGNDDFKLLFKLICGPL